jgi:hypothetical protein
MRKQLYTVLATIISAIVLISCQPNSVSPQVGENGDIQDIRVKVTEPTKMTSKVEQFPLPNCGGSDKLAQSLGTFASVSKSATVSNKGTVTGGGEVAIPETAKLKLEIQVELAYQKTFESVNSRVDTIEMSAAAGTHVVYTIVWEEQTFNSIVQYSSDGKVYEVPYTYQLSVPKIDTSYNVACVGNNDGSGSNLPLPTIPQSQATTTGYIPSCNWENDWQLQSNGSYLWVGSPPGTSSCQNVGQAGEILQRLRNGENLTLIVQVGDHFLGLAICRGNYTATKVIDGQKCVPNNPELWIQVSGTLTVTGSDGFLVGTGK